MQTVFVIFTELPYPTNIQNVVCRDKQKQSFRLMTIISGTRSECKGIPGHFIF